MKLEEGGGRDGLEWDRPPRKPIQRCRRRAGSWEKNKQLAGLVAGGKEGPRDGEINEVGQRRKTVKPYVLRDAQWGDWAVKKGDQAVGQIGGRKVVIGRREK